MKQEAVQLLSKINPQDYVILLDERGKQLSSEKFAHKLASIHHKTCVFIIGGAYGVDDSVRERADFVWSLSELVFPHQLVRLILAEQLYRAHCIQSSHPYHHS
jgi:23S rRNA (pseudouridine1915-N3)-methyltransferase